METEKQFFSNSQKSKLFRNVIIILIGVVILAGAIGIFYWQKKGTKPSPQLTPATPTSSPPTETPAEPSIIVLYPNGGEKWTLGQIYKVKWKSVGVEKVNILLIDYMAPESCYLNYSPIDAEKGEFVINGLSMVRCKPGAGSWMKEKITPGDKYVIRVENANDRLLNDSSDSYFSIVSSTVWKTYQEKPFEDLQPHKPWGFEFKYPKEFVLHKGDYPDFPIGSFLKSHHSGAGLWSVTPNVSVALSKTAYPGTNFKGAWITVSYDPDIANLSDCQKVERNQVVEKMTESQVINGIVWYKRLVDSAAAGTMIKSRVYHTFHNGMCYEITLHLAISNIGTYDPSLGIKPVDENEVWGKLESVLSTFRFLE